MARKLTVEFRQKTSNALNSQYPLGQYDFPFTCNPTIGCSFACKYCYSPIFVSKVKHQKRKLFFETVSVKLDLPQNLDKTLSRLSVLPQHLKRVQINETSEYYLPHVLSELKKQYNRDLMLEILEIFQKHWNAGNKWMLHILTKSPLILRHLDKLKEMKDMVQIEVSICNSDEKIIRDLEFYTPSVKKRMGTINELAKNDIFVRVMAMPYYGGENELIKLKKEAFHNGAKAFKNKALNYYDYPQLKKLTYDELINDKIERVSGRKDPMVVSLNEKSGETKLFSGKAKQKTLLFPKIRKWDTVTKLDEKLSRKKLDIIDCGYSQLNKVDWGYIV